MSMNKKIIGITLLIAMGCIVLNLFIRWYHDGEERGKSYAIAQHVASNLQVGMPRYETQQYVQEAWRYYACEYSNYSVDIYLFGSRDLSLTGILYLDFKKEGEQETLIQIASIEYYMLHQFDFCKITEK